MQAVAVYALDRIPQHFLSVSDRLLPLLTYALVRISVVAVSRYDCVDHDTATRAAPATAATNAA